jgi:hypothetical protein
MPCNFGVAIKLEKKKYSYAGRLHYSECVCHFFSLFPFLKALISVSPAYVLSPPSLFFTINQWRVWLY